MQVLDSGSHVVVRACDVTVKGFVTRPPKSSPNVKLIKTIW